MTDPLHDLAHDLEAIAAPYAGTADPLTGIRAVETEPGVRRYLCVRADGGVLCLDPSGEPVPDPEERHRVAVAVLLIEWVEEAIDGEECRMVATLSQRLGDSDLDAGMRRSVSDLGEAAAALADWRLDPMRPLARIADLDTVATLQSEAHVAHGAYLTATEPLVAVQDTLDGTLVALLRDLENACGRAGIAGSLAGALGQAMDEIDEGASELLGEEPARRCSRG